MNLNLNNLSLGRFSPSISSPIALGTIFTDNNFAAGSKYAISGAGITFSSGQINMTGGTASFNDYITLVDPTFPFNYTCLENWTISVKAIVPTINSTSYGIGVGVRSAEALNVSMNAFFRWGWDTGAVNQWYMYPNNSLTSQLVLGSNANPTGGSTIYIDINRNKNVYTCTAYQSDHTTIIGTIGTFTMSLSSGATNQANNTSRFVLENFGGTNLKVIEWTITSTAIKNSNYVIIGDSNTYGMFAGSNANRYAEHAMTLTNKSFTICAGIDDHTQDILNRLPEVLIGLTPNGIVLNIGSNDVADGVVTGTWQTNINSIVSQILGKGIRLILCAPIARNSNDLTSLKNFLAGISSVTFLDFYTATKGAGTGLLLANDSGDGIHGNLTCNNILYPILQAVL